MSDESLPTLKPVAAELGLPEPTVRCCRDAFLDHIPYVGMGRCRRYPRRRERSRESAAELPHALEQLAADVERALAEAFHAAAATGGPASTP